MAVQKPTAANFNALFESRADAPSAIEAAIDVAYSIYALSQRGCLYLAAHILELESTEDVLDGGAGELIAETLGEKKSEFMAQAMNGDETFYTTSRYGRAFLRMKKAHPGALGVRVLG